MVMLMGSVVQDAAMRSLTIARSLIAIVNERIAASCGLDRCAGTVVPEEQMYHHVFRR